LYPIKHKLKDCNMMKNFITSGALSRGKKPEGDPNGNGAAPAPGKVAIMAVFG
jgi:hypothetical protein